MSRSGNRKTLGQFRYVCNAFVVPISFDACNDIFSTQSDVAGPVERDAGLVEWKCYLRSKLKDRDTEHSISSTLHFTTPSSCWSDIYANNHNF